MNRNSLEDILKELDTDIAQIEEPATKKVILILLNLVEELAVENEALSEENQQLKDEVNRFKGEQGKPDIKGKNTQKNETDISSEDERKKNKNNANNDDLPPKKRKRQRESKLSRISIDREEICPVNLSDLPSDVVFKGYEDVVIQDIKIVTDNVKYRREVYYSPVGSFL